MKIDNEMQRWSSCQSRFKTRNSFAILLFASLNGTFRSMAYYQTIFEGNLPHRPKGASFYVDYISSGMDTFIRYVGSDFCTSGGTFLYVERDPPVMIPTLDSSILYVGSYDRSK